MTTSGEDFAVAENYAKSYANVVRYGAGDTHLLLKAMHENPEHQVPGSNLRLVAADSLDEEGRHNEADALRSGDRIHLQPPAPYRDHYFISRVVNGTHYWASTHPEVISALETARRSRTRVHISYGDQNGRDRLEEFETKGTVGRSGGEQPILLLVNNSRSFGGGPITSEDVVRIRETPSGRILWQHPNYHHGEIKLRPLATPLRSGRTTLTHEVLHDGEPQARFDSEEKARRWLKKMGLTETGTGSV